jgi:hypothetical protein
MKTKHEFQLEFEAQLAQIEDEIDEWRRERREERALSQKKVRPSLTSAPHMFPGED